MQISVRGVKIAKAGLWDRDLNLVENIACAWPVILLGFGGAIGGAFGALAWYLNVKVMKSNYIGLITYPAVILIGLMAWALYLATALWLVLQFPDVFAR